LSDITGFAALQAHPTSSRSIQASQRRPDDRRYGIFKEILIGALGLGKF
jgi:hypothetical protein